MHVAVGHPGIPLASPSASATTLVNLASKPRLDYRLGSYGVAEAPDASLESPSTPLRRRRLGLATPGILLEETDLDREGILNDAEAVSMIQTFSEGTRSRTGSFLLLDEDDPRVTGNAIVMGVDEQLREKYRKEVERLPPYTREKVAHALEAKLAIECMLIASLCAT